MDDRNLGCAADVDLGVFVDDLPGCHPKLFRNIENITGIEQDRVLVRTAFATPAALEVELRIQIHQLPLDFFHVALCRHFFDVHSVVLLHVCNFSG